MPNLLAEIRAEQRAAWQAGRRVPIQAYLDQHPTLADNDDSAIDLIYSEILLREEFRQPVVWEDYFEQFPRFAEKLHRQRTLHEMIKGMSSSHYDFLAPTERPDEIGPAGRVSHPQGARHRGHGRGFSGRRPEAEAQAGQ